MQRTLNLVKPIFISQGFSLQDVAAALPLWQMLIHVGFEAIIVMTR
jgi:hypothetical protein